MFIKNIDDVIPNNITKRLTKTQNSIITLKTMIYYYKTTLLKIKNIITKTQQNNKI